MPLLPTRHLSITIYSQHLQEAITLVYHYQPATCAPIDAGKAIADNRKTHGYRHLKEVYILNERFLPTHIGGGYSRYSSPICGRNNCFDGFCLTVATGRSLCAGSNGRVAPHLTVVTNTSA